MSQPDQHDLAPYRAPADEAPAAAEPRPEPSPFGGERLDLGGNRPFLLEAHHVYHVERGDIDLFSLPLVDGVPAGARRHLLRVRAGRILTGLGPDLDGRCFMAVPTNGTQLVRASRADLDDGQVGDKCARLRTLLDEWIVQLCQLLTTPRPRGPLTDLLAGGELTLDRSTVLVAPGDVIWVQTEGGRSLLLGEEALVVAGPGSIPLAAPAWLQASDSTRLRASAGPALVGEPFWNGLDQLGTLLRRLVELRAESAERASAEGARRQAAADQATIREACSRLAASLQPDAASLQAGDESSWAPGIAGSLHALVTCCRLVAATIGVEIKAPPESAGSSSLRDPIAAIMRSSRLRARKVALRGEWWQQDHGPLVAFTAEGNRPLALLRKGRTYLAHDPCAASRSSSVAAVDVSKLAPFAYMLYRPFPERSLSVRGLLEFAARGSGPDLFAAAACALLVTLLGMVPPFATGLLFNSAIPGAHRSQLWQMTVLLIACALANAGFGVVRGVALLRIQHRMASGVQAAVWDRLMRLPLTFFRTFSAGDLATRAMSIDSIQQILSGVTVTAILNGLFSLANLAMMFWYSPAMAWRAVLLLAVAVAVTVTGGLLRLRPEAAMIRLRARTSGLVLQLLVSISKLRVAGAEARAFAQWVDRFARQRKLQYKVRAIGNWLGGFQAAFPILASVLVFMAGLASLAERGSTLRTGDFLAFGAAFSSCMASLLGTCRALIDSLATVALYEQARPILQSLPEASGGKSDPGVLMGEIEVQHAVFRYGGDGPPILRDISLRVAPGEFVALVGPSGSGKSTLLKLLLGFEALESGSIHYDGQELRGLDIQEVRRQMGVVLQNGRLIVGDLYRNIVGSGTATEEEAWQAARMAGIADDIQAMPMKMHTLVSEDAGTLSGGQRQRLMIARAIVNRPRILLFDEATSALDNRTQAIVTSSLESLKATRIVVAHRLSTIANADRIYVIDRGRIVQAGSYSTLLKEKGLFAELARRQLV